MAGNLVTERRRRGDKGRGDRERADKGGGRGSGLFASVREGLCRCNLEGYRGGGVRMFKLGIEMWRNYKRDSIVNVTK